MPAVVGRFEEHRLLGLVVAAVARDADVSHAATTPGSLPGRLAEARCPAHLRLAGPQLVTERTKFGLIFEQRNGHLNDHSLTGCHESMIIVTCTDDRYREQAPAVSQFNGVRCLYSRVPRSSAAYSRAGATALHCPARPSRQRPILRSRLKSR